jgi:predicted ATP-grasp superfamily ATP-dependent carboligase
MRALVTGSSTFFAPLLIRGLGLRSVAVTAADSRWISMGKSSRFANRRLNLPVLSSDPEGYLKAIVRELKAVPYDILLPTFEESLLFAEYRDELEPFTRLFLPPFETMWQVHDKPSLHRLCQELRIPTPPTVVPRSPARLEQDVASLRFPVVVKLPAANNCVGRSFCENIPELIARYCDLYEQETRRGSAPPFVQQKIDGDSVYTLMYCHEGRKLGEVIYRPLRTYPERGGTSAHRESIEHPRIAELTERLAAATGWSGFLGLDFIVDRCDETPYLIDANPRANPGVQLGYLAGVDWTGMLIELVQGREPAQVTARPGIRTRTFLLDFAWLAEGCVPQRHWLQTAWNRLAKFRKPDWQLSAPNEFLVNGEWGCTLAMACQGTAAAVRSFASGRPIGQTMLDDVNYDAVTAEGLRIAKQNQERLQPAVVSSF